MDDNITPITSSLIPLISEMENNKQYHTITRLNKVSDPNIEKGETR